MSKTKRIVFALLSALILVAGCSSGDNKTREESAGTGNRGSTGTTSTDKMMSEDSGMHHGTEISEEYETVKNPFRLPDGSGYDSAAIAAGKKVFEQGCISCHGEKGDGKGPAGLRLDPPPRDFTADHMRTMDERRMFQVVSEGSPGTAMPAFLKIYTEIERWQVISFECSLNPSKVCSTTEGSGHMKDENAMH